jgi:hypothetical protein
MRALTCAAVGALAIAGCGGGDDDAKTSTLPPGKPDPQAQSAAQGYLDAYSEKDPKAICRALSPKVRKQLADNKGTCVKTIAFSIKGLKFPKLTVSETFVDGLNATATITGTTRQVKLQQIGSAWKVVDGGT